MADLRALQDELLALKSVFPSLKLKKTPAGSPGAPFPIIATATIQAPPQASIIDVQTLQLRATVTLDADSNNSAVGLEILSPGVPAALKTAISVDLERMRQASSSATQPLGLKAAFTAAVTDYLRLLCLLPECIERYEGVDAEGGTVRRVAILNDTTRVEIDASVPSPASPRATGSKLPSQQQQATLTSAAAAATTKVPPALEKLLPKALQVELPTLQRRPSLRFHFAPRPAASIGQARAAMAGMSLAAGNHASGFSFAVDVAPTDPEWNLPLNTPLVLECSFSGDAEYPAKGSFAMALGAGGAAAGMSGLEREVFNKLLEREAAAAAGQPCALGGVLRHCANHGGAMVHEAADVALEIEKRRRGAAVAAAAAASAAAEFEGGWGQEGCNADCSGEESEEESSMSGEESSSSAAGSESEDEEAPFLDDTGRGHSAAAAAASGAAAAPSGAAHRALNLVLQDLQLVDIDTLDIVGIGLQVACLRCKATGKLILGQQEASRRTLEATGECATCHAVWAVSLVPRIVHDGSNVLASMRAQGCAPVDVLPSTMAGQCSHCSGLAAFRSAQVGRWNERFCGSCHSRMAFLVGSAVFEPPARPPSAGEDRGDKARKGRPGGAEARFREVLIVPGQPLPDKGACKHYKHSYRWLRFPCCGRRFPCDICHEEETDGHEQAWAQRMVCGFCSTEQPVAQRCVACGKQVTTSASRPTGKATCFWEGGQGQRDLRRLSRNDPRKYKGSGRYKKTSSKKSERVGEKGREKRAAAAAAANK